MDQNMSKKERDGALLQVSFQVARNARKNGNHPFGALVADGNGRILMRAENTVVVGRDPTGHAETNLMSAISSKYGPEFLARCTIYTSTEPCPMCSGAIFWANVRRVVYGLGGESLYEMIGGDSGEKLFIPCREIFARGSKPIEVVGPLLEKQAREVHRGFWNLER